MRFLQITILLIIGLSSCNSSNKSSGVKEVENAAQVSDHPGKKLMETNCYVCHHPTTGESNRIAPPMIAIKKHYITNSTTKEAFIKTMQEWIKNPTEENSKMYGAVTRFGLMPKTVYPEETIRQIADYMYDYDIEQPDWFEEHFKQERQKNKDRKQGRYIQNSRENNRNSAYSELGLKYALSTKAVLGKNLMGMLQKEGTINALKYCNENALVLTDSMAAAHKAIIKRVSDKPRNSNNKASEKELQYIETFKNSKSDNQEISPITEETANNVRFYYPIVTNTMCLQCHGTPNKQITPKVYHTIKQQYPNDQAVGYDIDDIRGIWSISFSK